jgi:hypothetical protein
MPQRKKKEQRRSYSEFKPIEKKKTNYYFDSYNIDLFLKEKISKKIFHDFQGLCLPIGYRDCYQK